MNLAFWSFWDGKAVTLLYILLAFTLWLAGDTAYGITIVFVLVICLSAVYYEMGKLSARPLAPHIEKTPRPVGEGFAAEPGVPTNVTVPDYVYDSTYPAAPEATLTCCVGVMSCVVDPRTVIPLTDRQLAHGVQSGHNHPISCDGVLVRTHYPDCTKQTSR